MSFSLRKTIGLFALLFLVLADLSEAQRDRLTTVLIQANIPQYTVEILRTSFLELFCGPKTTIDDPFYHKGTNEDIFHRR